MWPLLLVWTKERGEESFAHLSIVHHCSLLFVIVVYLLWVVTSPASCVKKGEGDRRHSPGLMWAVTMTCHHSLDNVCWRARLSSMYAVKTAYADDPVSGVAMLSLLLGCAVVVVCGRMMVARGGGYWWRRWCSKGGCGGWWLWLRKGLFVDEYVMFLATDLLHNTDSCQQYVIVTHVAQFIWRSKLWQDGATSIILGALYTPPPIPTGLLLESQIPTRLD